MKVNYYLKSNGILTRKENTLYFIKRQEQQQRNGNQQQSVKVPIPIEKVFAIFCYGKVTLSSGSIHYLSKYNIHVHFFNKYGYKVATFTPRPKKVSGRVLLAQVSHHMDNTKRRKLASSFIKGGLENILLNMQYYTRNRDNSCELSILTENVRRYASGLNSATSINELMGCEANARKDYYKMLDIILPNPFKFEIRSIRPPRNMFNSLLSFGNSLVYSTVLSEIYATHLDPTISFLHELHDRRFSLSLDISEVFKPLLSDRTILHLVMKNELKETDFNQDLEGVMLNDEGRTKFIKHYEEKLVTTVKHRGLGRSVSYRGLIRLECFKIIKYLLGIAEYKPFVMWW